MSHAGPVARARVCESCRKTRLSGYNPDTFCTPCRRALFDREHPADPGARDDLATFAEIIATVPGQGEDSGQVCVTDEGGLTWTRDFWATTASIASGPEPWGQPADPASIASSVVEAVTRATSLLCPAEAGRAAHG